MDRLKLNISIVFLFVLGPVFSQATHTQEQNTPVLEKINISTNSNTLLTGEKLYYAITCFNTSGNSFSDLSKIAYVELISSQKKIVFKNKLFLKDSRSNNEYFIPTSLKTGKYKLIAYTNWMLASSSTDFTVVDLDIINPYQELDSKITTMNNQVQPLSADLNNLQTIYGFEKKKYSKREKLTLKPNASPGIDKSGSYSLKVVRKDSLAFILGTTNSTTASIVKKTGVLITPEFRGESVKGKIKPKKEANAELKNINIAVSITGNQSFFKIIRTNAAGEFAFTIETPTKAEKIQLQILDKEVDEYIIEIDEQNVLDYSGLSFEPVNISPNLKRTLEIRSVASQIENAYHNVKKDSLPDDSLVKNNYLKFDLVFNLDDYARFKTLKETLTEIIKGAYYKTVGKRNEIHIVDKIEEYELSHPALVLIDGYYIQDVNELFKYNVDNVKSISLIRGGYYYGTKVFNGIIFIKTKENDYESTNKNVYVLEPKLLRPAPGINYFNIDYSKNDYSRIPDYRHQLYWQPQVNMEEDEISFYTSDVEGLYEIILEGIDSKGNKVLYSESFEVN